MDTSMVLDEKTRAAKNITTIIYALYGASFVVGITGLIAIIINYVKKDDVAGTWLESHFRWQIRTFWWGLLWFVIGFVTTLILIGWVIVVGVTVWYIYRLIKGFLRLSENKPMYVD